PYMNRGLTWTQDIHVAIGYSDRIQMIPVHLSGIRTEVLAAAGLPAPLFILPNGGGIGYGEFHLDRATLSWLTQRLPEVPDDLTRGSAWVTLWDAVLDSEIPAARFLDLAINALP